MFKVESYLTPILMSYVNKYIKDFRQEDSKVSLWGGDACFHNLDLRLEVLEEELQLPFSFVSGHIHELLFHVPWTKLASEPITITINTIECILKLRTDDQASEEGGRSSTACERKRKLSTTKRNKSIKGAKSDELVTPPGYIQNLVTKIVNNITIYCNNLILKYVEEDIVLSVNIKTVKVQSANEKWEPAFAELSPLQNVLRKLITLSDLTVCLDKRNSSGKIELYQEPLLYRCVLELHLLRSYHSSKSKQASITRLDFHCFRMDFSLTEQQIPMLMRLIMLVIALQKPELKSEKLTNNEEPENTEDVAEEQDDSEKEENEESWVGWAWSWVPSILPVGDEEDWNTEQQVALSGHTLHLGVYIDQASVSFKVTESTVDRNYYGPRKVKFVPFLVAQMNGVFMDMVSHEPNWLNVQTGISSISLEPCGHCFCGVMEVSAEPDQQELLYFSAGSDQNNYILDSLFDPNSVENRGERKTYNISWDYHVNTITETLMLERSPALAFDLLHYLEIPEDFPSDKLPDIGSNLEYSNLIERSLLRVVVGPVEALLCAGLIHRLAMIQCAANAYDYDPYITPKQEPSISSLTPVSTDDFEALEANIPVETLQFTFFKPTITLCQLDHPNFDQSIFHNLRKRRKSTRVLPLFPRKNLPLASISCQCLDAQWVRPLYPERLVRTVCQLPDAPQHMFDACHEKIIVKLVGVESQLHSGSHKQKILLPCNLSFNWTSLLLPSLWKNSDVLLTDINITAESMVIVFTKPQLMILLNVFLSLDKSGKSSELLYSTSLLSDAFPDAEAKDLLDFLEVTMEGVSGQCVYTADTQAFMAEVGVVKVFILKASKNDTTLDNKQDQVLVLSGPDKEDSMLTTSQTRAGAGGTKMSIKKPSTLFSCTIQGPLDPSQQKHPPVLFFCINPISMNVDPVFRRWLMYMPEMYQGFRPETLFPESISGQGAAFATSAPKRSRRFSEAGSSLRSPNPRESVHSSSDRDQTLQQMDPVLPCVEAEESLNKESEEEDCKKESNSINFRELLLCWYPVWRGMVISGDISHCIVYIPTQSLGAVDSSCISDAFDKSWKTNASLNVFVIQFPYISLRSTNQRQRLSQQANQLPVKLTDNIWSPSMVNFPWSLTLTDTCIYTVQKGRKLHFLKPCSTTVTVGISTKPPPQVEPSTLTSVCLAVHVDASPVNIAISEEQVALMMEMASCLTAVNTSLTLVTGKMSKTAAAVPTEVTTPLQTPTSPTVFQESSASLNSPALKRADTEGSSERGVGGSTGPGNIKITAWMQCTLARLCVTIYAFERLKPPPLKEYKLLMEMEDIMTSFDVQQIYFKMKLKVASANVRHFTRLLSKDGQCEERVPWCPGPFLGVVMRPHEDSGGDAPSPSHHSHHHRSDTEDSGGLGSSSAAAANGSFLAATFTRARCVSVHSRWGTAPTGGRGPLLGTKGIGGSAHQASMAAKLTVSVPVITHKPKHRRVSPASAAAATTNTPSGIPQTTSAGSMNARFISEVIVKMQAVDIVLSPFTLQAFVSVMQPMLVARPSMSNASKSPGPLLEDNSFQLNGSSLPLLYLETRAVRLIIPASELVDVASSHDVFVLQYDNVSLSPQADNPLSRVLVRPDIYHWAEQAGLLRIPGSGIEDRQYQLDVSGLSMSTGRWQEFERVLSRPSANVTSSMGATGLRTMSENPALEWNQLQGSETIVPHVSLLPVIARADVCVVVAPAIVLEDGILVCGHSLEVNALKDIEMSASTQQLFLASALGLEIANTLGLLAPADSSGFASKTEVAKSSVAASTAVGVVTIDSGVDSVDVSSIPEDSVSGVYYFDAGAASTRNHKVSLIEQHVRLSSPDERCDGLFRNTASTDMKRQRTSTISGKSLEKSTNIIPFEILLTSRSWSCLFYDVIHEQHMSRMSPTEAFREGEHSCLNPMVGVSTYKKDPKAKLFEEAEFKNEEEESSLSNNSGNKTQPLLYIQLVQPHTFVSRQALTRKIQVSCFDVSIKTSRIEDHSLHDIPTIEDFNCGILETRGGDPHPGTGIPPSFLTIRWSCTLMKAPKLDMNVGRPCKILLSVPRVNSLLVLKNKLLQSFQDVTALTCHADDDKHVRIANENETSSYSHSHVEKDLEVCHLQNMDDKDAKLSELKPDETTSKEEEVQLKDVRYESKYAGLSGPAHGMHGFSSITLSTQQIVIAASTEEEDTEGAEGLLCVSGLNSCVTALGAGTRGAPERIAVNSSIHCLTLTTKFNGTSRLLINPWNFAVESCLAWESWHLNSPIMTLNVNSDCILLDVGPEHLCCLLALQTAFSKLIESGVSIDYSEEKVDQEMSHIVSPWTQRNVSAEVEQQYRDDLRAGAFQFVQSQGNLGRREELPLPYQVVFNASPPTMAWRYPQPRMLTRVEIFPVPFRVAKTEDSSTHNNLSEQVLCELQCWSEVRSRWLRVVQFELSESETRRLQLRPPGSVAAGPTARMWRVRLAVHRDSDDDDERGDHASSTPAVIVCPQTLAACMRVDSYFSPALIPYLQVAVDIAKIEVSLANHCGILGVHPMPPPLTRFSSDCVIPDSQTFAVLSIGNVSLSASSWQSNKCSIDASGLIQVDIIDYAYLTQHCALEPFRVHILAALAGESWSAMELSFVSRPISLRFGSALAHTLAVSMQLWAQYLPALALPMGFNPEAMDPACDPQVILTRYVICNDTNRAVRFGQVSTDEDLLLSSRQCHMYCWRSQKIKQLLRVSVDDGIWAWSSNFSIDSDGVQILPLSSPDASDALSIVVKVTALSATQKQVTFSGQMAIRNNLSEAFECKIVPESENSVRHPQYLIAEGDSFPPSLLISSGHNIVLRIRLQGLNSIWSGDIPLKVTPSTGQPWLVKVPLEDRNQFISIWCRVFHQFVAGGVRTLVMLCPLYVIQSHLPMPANIHVETPGLKVTTQARLSGRGKFQQLYCPGTIDHSHKLILQLDESLASNPYVPLSYSMIDEQSFFKPNWGESFDVDKMAEFPFGPKQQGWPFVDAGLSPEDWKACEKEPQTYVQVNYRPLGPYCATLLVELRPWVLLVNTLGVRVSVRCEDNIVCSVASHGVSMPPRLESTFHLVVDSIDSGSHFISPALQLARPDWAHSSFYMPRITGLIPREGNLMVVAPGLDSSLCIFNIHSSVVNEMRIVHFRPAFVFVNAICTSAVKVGLIAVPTNSKRFPYESSLQNLEEIDVPSDKTTLFSVHKEGTAMLYWSLLGKKTLADTSEVTFLDEKDLAFYVVISRGFGWSCPLCLAGDSPQRVQFSVPISVTTGEDALITESFVLTYKEKDGQVLLGLHPEKHPNLVVHNKCIFKLACAQSTSENNGKAIAEVEHINWWCVIPSHSKSHYHLPEVAKHCLSDRTRSSSPLLVFGLEDATLEEKAMWSYGIDISEGQERFLYLPGHGDVRVSVYVHCYTSYVSVETVSHVEISARDIRARLLEHGAEVETGRMGGERESTSDGIISFEENVYSKALQTLPNNVIVQNTADQQSTKEVMPLETDVGTSQYQLLRATSDVRTPVRSSTNCFIKGLYVTLLEDIPKGNSQRTEVIMLSLDNVCLTTEPDETLDKHKAMKLRILIGDLQVDNQMFQRGGFDFPVVLMGQPVVCGRTLLRDSYFSLSASAQRLIELTAPQTLVQVNITMMQPCQLSAITATDVRIAIGPLSAYVEDTLIMSLVETLGSFAPGKLVTSFEISCSSEDASVLQRTLAVHVPRDSLFELEETAKPLRVRSLMIEPLSILLSVHTSVKLYIALDHTPLQFRSFDRKWLVSTPYRLGHALTMHYLSGALFGLGWVVGSLELLGSPSGLARTLGVGLHDFITLPYHGIFHGPWAFLVGISHGSASLMKHITAGTLTSVTKMASSVARNLDRLTLDHEHMARAEELRRHRPQGLTQGLMQGLQGLGISILGAVGGIAHHPIQSVVSEGASPRGLVAGVGLGLVGVVTKPLSGAAEFVALTGEGLLNGAGWTSMPIQRHNPIVDHTSRGSNSRLKYAWKLVNDRAAEKESLIFVTEATCVSARGVYEAVALVLCTNALYLVNLEDDTTHRVLPLLEVTSFDHPSDPTLVCFMLHRGSCAAAEPTSHDRIVDFVRQSAGLVHGGGFDPTSENDSMSGSFALSGPPSEAPLSFFVNPQSRSYFLSLLSLVKRQCEGKGFPVL